MLNFSYGQEVKKLLFENFEYSVNEHGGVVIDKYLGNDAFVKIPDYIDGQAVFEIGDGAFRDMKFIEEIILPEKLKIIGNYSFCECRGIKEIVLPDGFLEAGGHSFYNCRKLERLEIPVSIEFIADGFIKNCEDLKEITVVTDGKLCSGIIDLITNINNEIEIIFKKQNAKIILPEYDYEYIGNAPAMRFMTLTHGSGVVFRRALEPKGFDYHFYDSFFFRAVLAERPETVLKMALSRLMYPYMLEDEEKNGYIKYIRENIGGAVSYAAKNGEIAIIENIDEAGGFDSETTDIALNEAAKCGDSEISAYLMNVKHTRFGKKKKSFDL